MMERQELPTIICFNKQELISGEELDRLCSIYRGSGCKVLTVSVKQQEGLDQIREILDGRINGHGRTFRCWQVLYD